MNSIERKIKKTIIFTLLTATAVFMALSVVFMFSQNRIILSENESIYSDFEEDTYNSLFSALKGYADDLGQSCLDIIMHNFTSCEVIGKSIANYAEILYTDDYVMPVDVSYGVGFAEGKTKAAIDEINSISDLREYISTYSEYDPENLDNLDIFAVTETGLVIDGTHENYGDSYKDLRLEKWYQDCKNTKAPLWTGVINGAVTGKQKIDYVSPIVVNDKFMGITVISMEINNLYTSLLKNDFKTIQEIALITSDGEKVICGNDFEGASKKFDLTRTGEMYIDDDSCWISYKLPDKSFTICFEFAMNQLHETVSTYSEGFERNNNAIRSHTGRLLFIFIAAYLVIALMLLPLFAIMSSRMGRSIVDPLLSLSKKVASFGKGNMDIDTSDINTDDEVGLLAETFHEMSENTKKYLAEIKEITADQEKVKAEMETAAKIQLSIMSTDFPSDSRAEVYAHMKPAKIVGGDVYAAFDIDEDHTLVFVGDVAGKGLPASFFSVRTKILVQIYGEMDLGPAETLRRINNRLCSNNDENLFVTAFLGVLDKTTGVFRYANAGHNKPIVSDEDPHFLNASVSLPLGLFEDTGYKDESITLKKGESIFIYTDGIPEAVGADDTFYSDERFLELVRKTVAEDYTALSLAETVDRDLMLHYNGRELWDDITMLILKIL